MKGDFDMRRLFLGAVAAACGMLMLCTQALADTHTPSRAVTDWSCSWVSPAGETNLTEGATGVGISLDEKYGGEASLHLWLEKNLSNLYTQAQQSVGIEEGHYYRLSGAVKLSGTSGGFKFRIGSTTVAAFRDLAEMTVDEWKEFEFIFKNSYANSVISVMIADTSGQMYIDNLSLTEVFYDETGENITGFGNDLIKNGDFESGLDLSAPGEISEISIKNIDSGANVSWKNPEDTDFSEVLIYSVTDGEEELFDRTADSGYEFRDLTNGRRYTFILKTADDLGNVSEGVTADIMPVVDAVKWKAPQFRIDGEETNEIRAGTLEVTAQVQNNSMPEDYSVELIVLLLCNNALADMASDYISVGSAAGSGDYTALTASVTVPEGAGYSAEVYIWDSLEGMEPLYEPAVLR